MTVKELIKRLLDCPMDAQVQIEVRTMPDFDYSVDSVNDCKQLNENRVLLK